MSAVTLHHGDCLDVLRTLPDASVDAVVTDPPYGLGFMGKAWDDLPPGVEWATECLRVLKPGGHILAFGGSRTWHRLAAAVEDAGFEIRDSIAWLYGSGFPKSLDVSKAITAHETQGGSSRRQNRMAMTGDESRSASFGSGPQTATTTATSRPPERANLTPAAEQWQGWGTALKPAFEPVVVGRKPLVGTVAANVLAHGTGALNIDACRIGDNGGARHEPGAGGFDAGTVNALGGHLNSSRSPKVDGLGRWPSNVVLDESQAAALDEQTGTLTSGKMRPTHTTASRQVYGQNADGGYTTMETYGDSGGASRFFKVAETDHRDEDDPLEECPDCLAERLDPVEIDRLRARFHYAAKAPKSERPRTDDGVAHPTVKPLALMRWLVRLVTPPGGVVLEPFAGSGTTVEACLLEGFQCIAIEREAEYLPLIEARLARAGATEPAPEPADAAPATEATPVTADDLFALIDPSDEVAS